MQKYPCHASEYVIFHFLTVNTVLKLAYCMRLIRSYMVFVYIYGSGEDCFFLDGGEIVISRALG